MIHSSLEAAIDSIGSGITLGEFSLHADEVLASELVELLSEITNLPLREDAFITDLIDPEALGKFAIFSNDSIASAAVALISCTPDVIARRSALLNISNNRPGCAASDRANAELRKEHSQFLYAPGVRIKTADLLEDRVAFLLLKPGFSDEQLSVVLSELAKVGFSPTWIGSPRSLKLESAQKMLFPDRIAPWYEATTQYLIAGDCLPVVGLVAKGNGCRTVRACIGHLAGCQSGTIRNLLGVTKVVSQLGSVFQNGVHASEARHFVIRDALATLDANELDEVFDSTLSSSFRTHGGDLLEHLDTERLEESVATKIFPIQLAEITSRYHLYNSKRLALSWLGERSRASGSSLLDTLADALRIRPELPMARYMILPEELPLLQLRLLRKIISEKTAPIFIARGAAPFATGWGGLVATLETAGVRFPRASREMRIWKPRKFGAHSEGEERTGLASYDGKRRFRVVSNAILSLLEPRERERILHDGDRAQLAAVFDALSSTQRVDVEAYLRIAWATNWNKFVGTQNLKLASAIAIIADAGLDPRLPEYAQRYKELSPNSLVFEAVGSISRDRIRTWFDTTRHRFPSDVQFVNKLEILLNTNLPGNAPVQPMALFYQWAVSANELVRDYLGIERTLADRHSIGVKLASSILVGVEISKKKWIAIDDTIADANTKIVICLSLQALCPHREFKVGVIKRLGAPVIGSPTSLIDFHLFDWIDYPETLIELAPDHFELHEGDSAVFTKIASIPRRENPELAAQAIAITSQLLTTNSELARTIESTQPQSTDMPFPYATMVVLLYLSNPRSPLGEILAELCLRESSGAFEVLDLHQRAANFGRMLDDNPTFTYLNEIEGSPFLVALREIIADGTQLAGHVAAWLGKRRDGWERRQANAIECLGGSGLLPQVVDYLYMSEEDDEIFASLGRQLFGKLELPNWDQTSWTLPAQSVSECEPILQSCGNRYALTGDKVIKVEGSGSDPFNCIVLDNLDKKPNGTWQVSRPECQELLNTLFSNPPLNDATVEHYRLRVLLRAQLHQIKHLQPASAVPQFISTLRPVFQHDEVQSLFPEGDVPFADRFEWTPHMLDYGFKVEGSHFLYHDQDDPDQRYLLKAPKRSDLIMNMLSRASHSNKCVSTVREVIVFPTAHCNLGCAHCRFAAQPAERDVPPRRLNQTQVRQLVDLVTNLPDVRKLSIGGGGEPTDERGTIEQLLAGVDVAEISIITGGTWGVEAKGVEKFFTWLNLVTRRCSEGTIVELNVSVDRPHLKKILPHNPHFLPQLVEEYIAHRQRGELNSVSLHLRTLSPDGCSPENDQIREVFLPAGWSVKPIRSDRYALFKNGFSILVSYNAYDRRVNQEVVPALLAQIRKRPLQDDFEKLFVSFDGAVSLGRYYASVPLGTIEDSFRDIVEAVASSAWLELLCRVPMPEIISWVSQETDLKSLASGCGLASELVARIAEKPSLVLFLVLCGANRLGAGKLLRRAMVDLGLGDAKPPEIAKFVLAVDHSTKWEQERRRNWGLRPPQVDALSVSLLELSTEERNHALSFGNPWWDSRNSIERSQMIDRLHRFKNLDPLLKWLQEEIGERHNITLNIRSITICGSFAYSLSEVIPPADIDFEIRVANPGLRDAAHYLSDFDFGIVLDNQGQNPRTINAWVISDDRLNSSTTNAIDIDVSYNAARGLVLYGPVFQEAPVPIVERLKMASFYANLILCVVHDDNFDQLIRRCMELQVLLAQAALLSVTASDILSESPNIALIDKNNLDVVQAELRTGLGESPEVFCCELRRLEALREQWGKKSYFDNRTETWLILKGTIRWKFALLRIICSLERILESDLKVMPKKQNRQWVYDIMAATNPFGNPTRQQQLSGRIDLDYPTSIALASRGASSQAILRSLISAVSKNDRLNDQERNQVLHAAAANPRLSGDLAWRLLSSGDNSVKAALLSNPGVPRALVECCSRGTSPRVVALRELSDSAWNDVLGLARQDRIFALISWLGKAASRDIAELSYAHRESENNLACFSDQQVRSWLETGRWAGVANRCKDLVNSRHTSAFGQLSPSRPMRFQYCLLFEVLVEGCYRMLGAFNLCASRLNAREAEDLVALVGACLVNRTNLVEGRWISGWGVVTTRWKHLPPDPLTSPTLFHDPLLPRVRSLLRRYWKLRGLPGGPRLELEISLLEDRWAAARTALSIRSTQVSHERVLNVIETNLYKDNRLNAFGVAIVRVEPSIEPFIATGATKLTAIEFHPAGDCNLACQFCLYGEKRSKNRHLNLGIERVQATISEFTEILGERSAEFEVRFGGIFSDPLEDMAHGATVAGIRAAAAAGFRIGLTTNGLGVDSSVLDALANPSARGFVNVSLDAGTSETWRALKRAGVSVRDAHLEFERIVDNLTRLGRLPNRQDSGLGVHVSVVMQDVNLTESELRKIIRLSELAGVDTVRFRYPSRRPKLAPERDAVALADQILCDIELEGTSVRIVRLHGSGDLQSKTGGLVQTKNYSICRVPFFRAVMGPAGTFHPCEHRAYDGGGSIGDDQLNPTKLISDDSVLKFVSSFSPAYEQRCECCPEYNHNLNVALDTLTYVVNRVPIALSLVQQRCPELFPTIWQYRCHEQFQRIPFIVNEPDRQGGLKEGNTALYSWFVDNTSRVFPSPFSPERILSGADLSSPDFELCWQILVSSPGARECFNRIPLSNERNVLNRIIVIGRSLLAPVQSTLGYEIRVRFGGVVLQHAFRSMGPDISEALIARNILKLLQTTSTTTDERKVEQAVLCLDIFRDKFAEFLDIRRTLRPGRLHRGLRVYVLFRDGEPLYERLSKSDSPFYSHPIPLFISRLDLLTAPEAADRMSRESVLAGDYQKSLTATNGKIYEWLTEPDGVLFSSAIKARDIAATWVINDRKHSAVRSERAADIAQRAWLILIAQHLVIKMQGDPDINMTLRQLVERNLSTELEQDDESVLFVDSGFKGSLVSLLAALTIIARLERIGKDPMCFFQCLLEDPIALYTWDPPATPFVYGCVEPLRTVLPNAEFDRWGHGGVNEFLEALPKRYLRSRGQTGQHYMRLDLYSSAPAFWQSFDEVQCTADRIPKVSDVLELIEQIAVHSENSREIVVLMDLDDVVFRPLVHLGSEQWFRDRFSKIPPWQKKARHEQFTEAIKIERNLLASSGWKILLDPIALRRGLKERIPTLETVRIVALTARDESTQSKNTRCILTQLGILDAFDDLDFASTRGLRKVERVRDLIRSESLDMPIFLVDDAAHNLLPVSTAPINVTSIHYIPPAVSHSPQAALCTLSAGVEAALSGNVPLAQLYWRDAQQFSLEWPVLWNQDPWFSCANRLTALLRIDNGQLE